MREVKRMERGVRVGRKGRVLNLFVASEYNKMGLFIYSSIAVVVVAMFRLVEGGGETEVR
jgi:hypothetical protein